MFYLRKNYSTHLPLLMKMVLGTGGPVLEFGAGVFSTPVLHWLCSENRRELVTYENDLECYKFAKQFRSRNHKIVFVKDWGEISLDKHWSVVLIDHGPLLRRSVDAIRFKNNADFIVLHDTEEKSEPYYNYDSVWPHFKFRYDHELANPRTTVVSNFKDPREIF